MQAYELQDSLQTLAEAVAEYYAANPGLASVRNMSPEAQRFFRSHDVAHVSIEIYKRLRLGEVLRSIARSVAIVPRTALRCLRQRSRWPWAEFEGYLDVSLRDIRQRFGIEVARSSREE